MTWHYDDLPPEEQAYLDQRFTAHGLDSELAYDYLIPDAVKTQGPDSVEIFMRQKDISHIYPQSDYLELADQLNNVFLEDPDLNAARGDRLATPDEVWAAHQDNLADAWELFG